MSEEFDEAAVKLFSSKVDKRGPDECWLWIGRRSEKGYGIFSHKGKKLTSSRVALSLHLGRPIADGLFCLHSCDNPPCCNPQHLREGTHIENINDAIERDRFHKWAGSRSGSKNPRAKLNEKQVSEIRSIKGLSQRKLADLYGISKTQVLNILNKENWGGHD